MRRLALCLALTLAACGGGGAGVESPTPVQAESPQPVASYLIAGLVTAANGDAQPGVTVSLTGAASSTTISDANGAFSFAGLSRGTYSLTPAATGQAFSPAQASVNVQGQSVTGVNFSRVVQSFPSTQVIADYMTIRHSQMLTKFVADEKGLGFVLAGRGLGMSGTHYIQSGQSYVSLVQAFAADTLAFALTRAQSSAIDTAAIASLLSTYAAQDAAYADNYYRGVPWGLSAVGLTTFIADINKQTDSIYALTILQLP